MKHPVSTIHFRTPEGEVMPLQPRPREAALRAFFRGEPMPGNAVPYVEGIGPVTREQVEWDPTWTEGVTTGLAPERRALWKRA